jgi:DNA (cytosine-5)-methyltransferase 1
MNYIELFAGIGGFRSAMDKLGFNCVFSSEIDKHAQKSYKTLYGEEELNGDITKIEASDIPDHDILVGGFPCQAFSIAGQRKGFEDTRGTLFFDIIRIAQEKRPKYLFMENVKGLLSHEKGRTFEIMCETLTEIGYAVDFEILNSKYFGVPQNRERIFIIGSRDAEHESWQIKNNNSLTRAKKRIQELNVKTFNFNFPENKVVEKRLRDILEKEVNEKYYLSEEKTQKLVEELMKEKSKKEPELNQVGYVGSNAQGNRVYDSEGISATISSQTGGIGGSGGGIYKIKEPELNMIGKLDIKGMDAIKRVYDVDGLAPTLTTMQGGNTEPKIAELQQYSDGTGLSYTIDANYAKGTSVGDIGKGRRTHIIENNDSEIRPVLTPDRAEKRQNGRRFKENDEEMFTLTAQDLHGIAELKSDLIIPINPAKEDGSQFHHQDRIFDTKGVMPALTSIVQNVLVEEENVPDWICKQDEVTRTLRTGGKSSLTEKHNYDHIHDGWRIRKLTPLECFRLQGFTDEQFYKLKNAGISDSQLYKQAGNAVTVNVIEEIARKFEF